MTAGGEVGHGAPMPRFYFDIRDGERCIADQDGLEFEGLAAAEADAVRTLTEMLKDALPNGRTRELAIAIRDEADRALTTARLCFEMKSGP